MAMNCEFHSTMSSVLRLAIDSISAQSRRVHLCEVGLAAGRIFHRSKCFSMLTSIHAVHEVGPRKMPIRIRSDRLYCESRRPQKDALPCSPPLCQTGCSKRRRNPRCGPHLYDIGFELRLRENSIGKTKSARKTLQSLPKGSLSPSNPTNQPPAFEGKTQCVDFEPVNFTVRCSALPC